jgi:biotin transport system substrate-specific component
LTIVKAYDIIHRKGDAEMKKSRIYSMVLCAMFAALIAVGAFIRIPVPMVPFTLQITFTTLAGYLLGAKKGAVSVIVYVVLGLIGLPIFTEGGGLSYIFKPTFGYLPAFIIGTFITGVIAHKVKKPSYLRLLAAGFIGLAVVYVIGVAYLYMMYHFYLKSDVGLWALIMSGCILVLPGNAAFTFLAAYGAKRLIPITYDKINA